MFELVTDYSPEGDQPKAIDELYRGIVSGKKYQTLLGVTGSGKTFTMANLIARTQRPTLVISHNKTLAAQLYGEFKEFFPHNAVEYFVSYYDYYQPEAYIPQTDIYIEKDSSINEELDRLRLASTTALMSRKDVIIVASVSCIYNLGSPEDYQNMLMVIEKGAEIPRKQLLHNLVEMQYERNDTDLARGTFRVKGEIIEIFPAYEKKAIRIQVFADEIEAIYEIHPVTLEPVADLEQIAVYPAKHFMMGKERIEEATKDIEEELRIHLKELENSGKLLEAQRLASRTKYDLEMLNELGYCHGIENYSRHLSRKPAGARPCCLIDYFPEDFLTIIDESHATIPQIGGMYNGDRSRKLTLVEHGFRLPSALDNRPLNFTEFEDLLNQVIFVSATPADYEKKKSENTVTEQIIRPTGLLDPPITILPTKNQIDTVISLTKKRAKKKERTFITTLTKRMAEELAAYLQETGMRVKYLHSEIDTIERVKILKELRLNEFDCLVGINLLREGLDLPEVSLVIILDADKEGFLRSETSLIQVAGRAARNANGEVIMFADSVTKSMQKTIDETNRRRKIQLAYNKKNNITPQTIKKAITEGIETLFKAKEEVAYAMGSDNLDEYDKELAIAEMEEEMMLCARNLQFEKAAVLRDKIKKLKEKRKKWTK